MGWFKKLVSGVKDVAKAVSYVVAAPVNSITGHEYKPDYETNAGASFGRVLENSVDNVHALGKGFADGLLGGLPTKLVNKIRKPENRETPGNYLENTKDYKNKILNGLNRVSGALGSAWGSKGFSLTGSGGSETTADSTPTGVIPELKFAAVIAGIVLVFAFLYRLFK